MASNNKNVGGALDLTRELETSEGIQQQLWVEAQKARAAALKGELREVTEANRHLVEGHLETEERIQWLKYNHGQIMATWERV